MINKQRGIAPIAILIAAILIIGGGTAVIATKNKGQDKKQDKVSDEAKNENERDTATSTPQTIKVDLAAQNNSGQSGQAIINEVNGKIKVILNLTGKPSVAAQPAHIHVNNCSNIGAPKYTLNPVSSGASITEIDAKMSDILASLPLSINVHKSAADSNVYVACGDVKIENKSDDKKESKDEKVTDKTKEYQVMYNKNGFAPKTLTIKKGQKVMFVNKTGSNASFASDPHPTHTAYPEFDQYKTEFRGMSEFPFTFEKVGTWKFHDHLKPQNGGTIVAE